MKYPIKSLVIALFLILIGCGEKPISSLSDATSAISNRTFEFKDETGLPYGIPVGINRIEFNSDGSKCSTYARLITEEKFQAIYSDEVNFQESRYIDTGEKYIQMKCGKIGFRYFFVSDKKLDVYSAAKTKPFTTALRI